MLIHQNEAVSAKQLYINRRYKTTSKTVRSVKTRNNRYIEVGTFDNSKSVKVLYISGTMRVKPREGFTPKLRQQCVDNLRLAAITHMKQFTAKHPHIDRQHLFNIAVDDTIVVGKTGNVSYEFMFRPSKSRGFAACMPLLIALGNRIDSWIQNMIQRNNLGNDIHDYKR